LLDSPENATNHCHYGRHDFVGNFCAGLIAEEITPGMKFTATTLADTTFSFTSPRTARA